MAPLSSLRLLHAMIGLAVCLAALGLGAWTVARLHHERATLVSVLTSQRREQLEEAANAVEEGLRDIHDDLEYTASTVVRATSGPEMVHTLEALLLLARPYRAVAVYDHAGDRALLVVDPRWEREFEPQEAQAMDRTAARARTDIQRPVISSPLPGPDGDFLRVFAQSNALGAGSQRTVAFLVDTRPILARLATVSGDRMASLLVLGPHGSPASISESGLAAAAAHGAIRPAWFEGLLQNMLRGEAGTDVVPSEQAEDLGFPAAELLVVRVPIQPDGERNAWSAAAFVSTEEISGLQAEAARALTITAGLGTVLLLGFGVYVAVMMRRDAVVVEQLRSAHKVAHLRDRAERILDHVPVCVAAISPDGRVTAFNSSHGQRFRQASTGGTLREALPGTAGETLDRLEALLKAASDGGTALSIVGERLTLCGEEGEFSIHAVPIHPASDDVGALMVIEDHTPLRRLRDRMLRVEKLATVGVLAAGIAHEVGTPLGVIRGRAEFTAQKLGLDHPQAPALVTIVEQIDRIVRIIRALLDFASPRPVASDRVDLQLVGEKVRELVTYELLRRSVSLEIQIAPTARYLRGDEDQLQQVLINLVLNAVDASPPGGIVEIATGTLTAGQVLLTVADQGIGIAGENLHRIFDPFFTTKKRGHGTGLGLAIVDQIVRDHGGSVHVYSELGKGAVFEVNLPQDVARLDPVRAGPRTISPER
jgi:two-component system sensor histidine kinase HydH